MKTRYWLMAFTWLVSVMLLTSTTMAAPMARILRIDPYAAMSDGAPVLTVVVDLVESKRLSSVKGSCGGDTNCEAEKLEQPKSLFQPFPYPEANANFLVEVDGSSMPTKFVSKARWGESLQTPGVGTAWLILVDVGGTMSSRLPDAKTIANAFISSMTPHDIVNVMAFDGRQVVQDSKWLSATKRNEATSFVNGLSPRGSWGRTRALSSILRTAVSDSFNDLGNVGSTVAVPLHQALVILSDGAAGTDPSSTGAGATLLAQHFSKGRFPEDNSALPKTPLPVISIWFPRTQVEELSQNAQEFMSNLANPEYGGFLTNVNPGGGARAQRIVATVRDRFNQMHIVKYRVSCVATNLQQTFQLFFSNIEPMIGGDNSFKDVPVGIDPTTWPLDVDVAYTTQMAKKKPVHPGGTFRVYGNFCWGGDKSRAEVYFLPKNQAAPPSIQGRDIETAKRAQQQLIAMNMRGKVKEVSDSFVEFEAPDDPKILLGKDAKAVVRLVVYDNKAKRTSAVDANNILTLKGQEAPFPVLIVAGITFASIVLLLLVIAIIRGGGGKRGRAVNAPTPAPVVAGQPYAPTPYGGAPQPAQPPMPQQGYQPMQPPAQQPMQPPMGAQGGSDAFMYGNNPGAGAQGFGLTGAMPQYQQPPPPNPYGPAGNVGHVVLSGPPGNFTLTPGQELFVGRDGARCQVLLQEPRVSGVHASLLYDGNQVFVRDHGSNNGTQVNGNPVGPNAAVVVPIGSMLRFGPVEFVLRME